MPELPEVETIVRYLRPKILGKQILELRSDTPRLFRDHKNIAEVKRAAVGQKVEEVSRAGKNIVFRLPGGNYMLIHLMMTGKLLLNPQEKGRHDRMTLKLSGNTRLVLNDIRKFGRIRLISGSPTSSGKSDFGLGLGPDALSLSRGEFQEVIRKRNGAIKNLLMNQQIVSGIGNIYADEILWYAGIKPTRKTDSLKEKELKKLSAAIKNVLKLAIRKEGTSSRDYRKPDGSEGGYYKIRKVYQRAGEHCSRDGGIIKRIVVGQRGTHFCPVHQK